ncbi:MAG: hypothetical protein ACI9LG_002100, partial [Moritella dasanensis]
RAEQNDSYVEALYQATLKTEPIIKR